MEKFKNLTLNSNELKIIKGGVRTMRVFWVWSIDGIEEYEDTNNNGYLDNEDSLIGVY